MEYWTLLYTTPVYNTGPYSVPGTLPSQAQASVCHVLFQSNSSSLTMPLSTSALVTIPEPLRLRGYFHDQSQVPLSCLVHSLSHLGPVPGPCQLPIRSLIFHQHAIVHDALSHMGHHAVSELFLIVVPRCLSVFLVYKLACIYLVCQLEYRLWLRLKSLAKLSTLIAT